MLTGAPSEASVPFIKQLTLKWGVRFNQNLPGRVFGQRLQAEGDWDTTGKGRFPA